jgi:hypothetical protein
MYVNGVVRRGNRGTGIQALSFTLLWRSIDRFMAAYVLAYFLFTIHEEIGISSDAALPIAVLTFPIMFLGTLIDYLARKGGLGRH